jgi:hypothetical protein
MGGKMAALSVVEVEAVLGARRTGAGGEGAWRVERHIALGRVLAMCM